jgi:hypothetical protein
MPTDTRKAAITKREARDSLRSAKRFGESFISQAPSSDRKLCQGETLSTHERAEAWSPFGSSKLNAKALYEAGEPMPNEANS